MKMNKTYVILADGFEEIEALTVVDLLRRAGVEVVTLSINKTDAVVGAHGIEVAADAVIDPKRMADAEMIVLPGGMPGASNLADCAEVVEALGMQIKKGGKIAAICAAPAVVLAPLGILEGKDATCYPGFEEAITAGGGHHKNQRVVKDGHIITANGPSSATAFALTLIEVLRDQDAADAIAAQILL